jgi:UDP-N-acetylglucosamine--N-acetylmuramyl-(pentapeptide) pyrophosphoryl-undecaprenol N-acetylglucosamine transferase
MTTPQAVKTALVMAGGTGGHIFPGLAVAEALRSAGWRVVWLGAKGTASQPSMEFQLVPPRGFEFEAIEFGGVRGKGAATLLKLPVKLLRACLQSLAVLRRVKPDVVLGLGGYISLPAGLVASLIGRPLVLHEQNSVAGMANKVLARQANKVYAAFPDAFASASKALAKKSRWIGNPLRAEFLNQPEPAIRFAHRRGPLRLLVLGGSLGAQALNEVVPKALALIPQAQRPLVCHQSGHKQIDRLIANYADAAVLAELTPFIEDTAVAFANADLVICRAGASTVTEIAAIGAAAVFVPFPAAVDDHQTSNAAFLVNQGGGWLVPQSDLTPERLARMLQKADRPTLLAAAQAARKMQKVGATDRMVAACEAMAAHRRPQHPKPQKKTSP